MEDYKNKTTGIKAWAEEDRPREKLLHKGKQMLTNAELIAILIGSGSREVSAVELARQILQQYDNDLNGLGKKTISELTRFKGIGEAKAITIVAALELGRRRQSADIKEKKVIKSSTDIFEILHPVLADLPHEEFWVLFLNRANKVVSRQRVSLGGVSGTVADAKIIFKSALEHLASFVVLCHNHPSGTLNPSDADMRLTKRLSEAGKMLDIPVLDHLIITEAGYYSFADEGIL